ncbi:S24 family peptidase [Mycoplasmatota bacterium WC44]
MSLGKTLKELRRKKKVNQGTVAEFLGVNRTTYTLYELDKNSPDYSTLKKLAKYFAVTIDYLLEYQLEEVISNSEEFNQIKESIRRVNDSWQPTVDSFQEIGKETNDIFTNAIDKRLETFNDIYGLTGVIKNLLARAENSSFYVPCIKNISQHKTSVAAENVVDYILLQLPTNDSENYFILEVQETNLIDDRIKKGDRVLVKKSRIIENNDRVIIANNKGKLDIRHYKEFNDGTRWLLTNNENHQPILYNEESKNSIIGKVIQIIMNV